jgi:Histidine kinase-, DNA gyrase B-, and HSP90-like ATPase
VNRGGMGFGLTICKMLTQHLKGSIEVESEFGKGSIFTIKIKIEEVKFNSGNIFERCETNTDLLPQPSGEVHISNFMQSEIHAQISKKNGIKRLTRTYYE